MPWWVDDSDVVREGGSVANGNRHIHPHKRPVRKKMMDPFFHFDDKTSSEHFWGWVQLMGLYIQRSSNVGSQKETRTRDRESSGFSTVGVFNPVSGPAAWYCILVWGSVPICPSTILHRNSSAPSANYCWWQPEIRRSPVEVGSWNPIIYEVLYIPHGMKFLQPIFFNKKSRIEAKCGGNMGLTLFVETNFP